MNFPILQTAPTFSTSRCLINRHDATSAKYTAELARPLSISASSELPSRLNFARVRSSKTQ